MPAGSEVTLPHTWRPFGVRMAAIGFGVMLLFVCAFAWFALPSDIRASFTLFQRGTLLALGGMVFAAGFALVRCRLEATERGLTVVNGYRRRDLAWAEVIAINLPQGAPWAVLDLADGTSCPVLAIQGSDGSRARRDLAQVRALLARP